MIDEAIAYYLHERGVGVYETSDPALRTIFVGELPENVSSGLYIVSSPSPEPHRYLNTIYPVLDFYYRSPHTKTAQQKLDLVYELFERKTNWGIDNWLIYYSHTISPVVDLGRDNEGGKLLRLSVQFISRNLNGVS